MKAMKVLGVSPPGPLHDALGAVLEARGYSAEIVDNFICAREILQSEKIDAVIVTHWTSTRFLEGRKEFLVSLEEQEIPLIATTGGIETPSDLPEGAFCLKVPAEMPNLLTILEELRSS